MHSDGQESLAAWGRGVAYGTDAREISDHVAALWRGIGIALSPVIGQDGLSALYWRRVELTRIDHPWLPAAGELVPAPDLFATLHAALVQVSDTEAANAASALRGHFQSLLNGLFGDLLAERLLRSVRSEHSNRSAQSSAS